MILNYDLPKLESELLSFQLDSKQKEVLESALNYIKSDIKINSDTKHLCISGRAGTGKTQICALIVKILKDNNIPFLVITPTNKSKNVIASVVDSEAITVHRLLSLSPQVDILELDLKELNFIQKNTIYLQYKAVWIIDECSMVNDDLYKLIIDQAINHQCKIIWLGDEKQLSPVNQKQVSKTFRNSTKYTLDKIYRQSSDSPIGKILETLRSKPISRFESTPDSDSGSLKVYNNIREMLEEHCYLFKVGMNLEDQHIIKLVTYTNKRIEALNQIIRRLVFNDDEEYHFGEVLTGYDSCMYKNQGIIENSSDYLVREVEDTTFQGLKAYKLTLYDPSKECDIEITIISRYNSSYDIANLAARIDNMRVKAVKSKNGKDWRAYYQFQEAFLTPFDLVYEGRVIKRKSLDYGYCISAHKSQSSSYLAVLVDMENILQCTDPEELRQLQYVALSRTTNDIYLYQR